MKDNEQQLEDIEASHALDGASYILFRYINLAEGGKILAEVELRNLWNLFVCVYGFEHTSVSFVFRSLNMNTNLKERLSYSVYVCMYVCISQVYYSYHITDIGVVNVNLEREKHLRTKNPRFQFIISKQPVDSRNNQFLSWKIEKDSYSDSTMH